MLTATDWVVAFLPLVLSAMGVYFSHEAKPRRKLWSLVAVFIFFGLIFSLANLRQLYNNRKSAAATQDELTKQLKSVNAQLSELRRQNPIRLATVNLAREILAFAAQRDSYFNRFKPGQVLSDRESAEALDQSNETIRIYHAKYARRAVELINRIGDLTGKDVSAIEQKAKNLRASGQVQEVGNELAALADTL